MTTEPDGDESGEERDDGSRSLAIAVVAGVILFAITDNPVWIAIGVAVGAALAARARADD